MSPAGLIHVNLTERFLALALLGADWILWLLVILSVTSIAVMIERAWFFRSQKGDWRRLASDVRLLLEQGKLSRAVERTQDESSCVATIISSGLRRFAEGPDAAAQAMDGAKALVRLKLEKNLAFLGTLGANAPFIGLFGTVMGVIQAFHNLATEETKGPRAVMGSLSEALIATAVGLIVAIPAVMAYNYFQRRVRGVMLEADALAHGLLADLFGMQAIADAAPVEPAASAAQEKA